MITRERRLALNHYAEWKAHHGHCLATADELRQDIVQGNERRGSKIEGEEIDYLVAAIQRHNRLHLKLLRSVNL